MEKKVGRRLKINEVKSKSQRAGGKVEETCCEEEVKKSTRGGKEGGAQDTKRVADKVAHMQIFLDIHV